MLNELTGKALNFNFKKKSVSGTLSAWDTKETLFVFPEWSNDYLQYTRNIGRT